MNADFLRSARKTYAGANAANLRWMLDRPLLQGVFLNTKLNSITLRDYTDADGMRGPDVLYGWIQGRGLEALATHAAFFADEDQALSERLDEAGRALYHALDTVLTRDGHIFFAYDRDLRPVYPDADGILHPQDNPPDIFTYSDIFAIKGLVAAAARYAPGDLPKQLARFDALVSAIEDGRFQMDERRPLGDTALAEQADDFGPRMILLGAAGMLQRLGLESHAGFADRFIAHVLDRHFDEPTGLLRNVPGQDSCNVGHAIEFVGFAFDKIGSNADRALVNQLKTVLIASFRRGFITPGIALSVSIQTGQPLSAYCPWWSLPEAIRASALCFEHTQSPEILAIWQEAHDAFFKRYWRNEPPIAYQTMTPDGPIDFVPATPDLDPGYHTGLSLLSGILVADRLLSSMKR